MLYFLTINKVREDLVLLHSCGVRQRGAEVRQLRHRDRLAHGLGLNAPAMKAAVLGSPIAHSLSPVLHRAGYQALGLDGWAYQAIECDEAGLPGLIGRCGPDWAGLSLTMPLKRAVLPLLDEAGPLVAEVGAANTVIFDAGQRHGSQHRRPGHDRRAGREPAVPGGSTARDPSRRWPAARDPAALILGAGATACSALAAVRGLGLTRGHGGRPRSAAGVGPGGRRGAAWRERPA